eukprot:TRINITY_DN2357_c0_g2_i1.p1 TRINITY_DN2357_c0_g2~~TRINITY_DN2357_c0_g2_i1.p1  ORF type:complete len:434 (+),score=106.87 TRINITY_DN2357_c0_g2_i1:158-1303(+)
MGHRLKILQRINESPVTTIDNSASSSDSPDSSPFVTSSSRTQMSSESTIPASPREGPSILDSALESSWAPPQMMRSSSHRSLRDDLQQLCLNVFETRPATVFTSKSFDRILRTSIQAKDETTFSNRTRLYLLALAGVFRGANASIQKTILDAIGMATLVKWTKSGHFPIFSEINRDRLVISEKRLGKGGEASVWLGTYAGSEVAVKVLADDDEYSLRAVLAEATYMSICRSHPNVVRCYGVSTISPYCLIMEYCALGSLRDVLRNKSIDLNYPSIINLSLQCAMAVQHLHSLGIIHRDLKSLNFLVTADLTCKITDFGISRLVTNRTAMTGLLGSLVWMAPEVFKKKPYTNKADSFFFGFHLEFNLIPTVPRNHALGNPDT